MKYSEAEKRRKKIKKKKNFFIIWRKKKNHLKKICKKETIQWTGTTRRGTTWGNMFRNLPDEFRRTIRNSMD